MNNNKKLTISIPLFLEYALKEVTRRKSRALLSILGVIFSIINDFPDR
jgi:hypothetical protein